MALPSLRQLYEEENFKYLNVVVAVAGHILTPTPREISYSFAIGETPTLSFSVDNPPPLYLQEDAACEVYVGFNNRSKMVFNGSVESVSPSESGCRVQAVGMSRRLSKPYKRSVSVTDGVTSSNDLVEQIMVDAKVPSYHVNLPAWTPGTAVQQPLQFSTWGEGVNKLAEPFASPFYELPSGQIRVELRDPIPAPSYFRHYFSGILKQDGTMILPANVVNTAMQPRIRNSSEEKMFADIKNKVTVRGASLTGTGGDGETTTNVIEETADAPSPWIPDLDGDEQFVEMTIDNELLDTVLDAAAVAARYLILYNRLVSQCDLTVEGDPEIFLGATVQVTDIRYSAINAPFFVQGYTCNISNNDFSTSLTLVGGRSAGTTPRLSPFAAFTWRNVYSAIQQRFDNQPDNSASLSAAAAKLKQFVPEGAQDAGEGDPGSPGQKVIITFDASASVDPDGSIVKYAWTDDAGHTAFGRAVTFIYGPESSGGGTITLTVTDNEGKTDSQTESFNINTFGPQDGYGPDSLEPGSGNIDIGDAGIDEDDTSDPDSSPDDEHTGDDGDGDDGSGNGGLEKKVLTFIAAQNGGYVQYPNGAYRRLLPPGPAYCVACIANYPPASGEYNPANYGLTSQMSEGLVVFGTGAGINVFRFATESEFGDPIWLGQWKAGGVYSAILGLRLQAIDNFLALNSTGTIFQSVDRGHNMRVLGQVDDLPNAGFDMITPYRRNLNQMEENQWLLDEPNGTDPPARMVTFGTEAFEFHPDGNSFYYPDMDKPDKKFTISISGLVAAAPSMAEDGAYYLVDKNANVYFGQPPSFTLVQASVLSELGLISSGHWEPGTEGTFMLGGEDGAGKSFNYNFTDDDEDSNNHSDNSTPDWPGGFVYMTATWQFALTKPDANLLSLTAEED